MRAECFTHASFFFLFNKIKKKRPGAEIPNLFFFLSLKKKEEVWCGLGSWENTASQAKDL